MSLGNKLTWYLLVGVLAVTGLDVYLSLTRTRANLLDDLRREVAAISRTLRVTLEVSGDDEPERYFAQLAPGISGFENILGVVFYDRAGRVAATSASLQGRRLPEVDVRTVIRTRTPIEGLFSEGSAQRYYRVEAIPSSTGEGIAAFLVLEDFPLFTREFRGRMLQTLLTILMLLVVLAVIVSVVIRQSVTQPLRTLTRQIEAIGQGQLDQRLHLTRRDEIGQVAQEFDHMCARLEEAHSRLVTQSEEKLRLERALRHSEKLAALGQLASRLAHEIGTPLNVIQGRAEQLLQRKTLAEKDRAFLGVIVTQIEQISKFIRQLLTLARRSEPQLRAVRLNEIVGRVWEIVGDRGNTGGVEITLALADDVPPILGDPEQLQQVLLNLSVNAVQAVGASGRVTLSTRCQPNGSPGRTGMVEAVVADTGPGISPQDLPHIFEPFFTTKGMVGGTGLGLAICREIVLNHCGDIRVESEPGQGARFIVVLPRAVDQSERQTTSALQFRENLHGND
ncbi:MAG TPA: ATP-binding protein, partial [Candidatus Binatia bacterium]|nr:ATP-binding protein [Candidatus Binatia bacterium]